MRGATSEARAWAHVLPDGRLQCDLCPRACRLRDGQDGFCAVRRREGDAIVLAAYGRTSGLCVDPIEKKPLYHFLPGSRTLSLGTVGCNLACRHCQNWGISRARDLRGLGTEAAPEGIARLAVAAHCASVALTYNEPIVWAEYAIDTALASRARGLAAVAVTAGYIGERARAAFFGAIDAANVDLKGFSPSFYRDVCLAGEDAFHSVLDTLRYVRHETRVWLEITRLLIPGLNDSDAEIDAGCAWIARELGPDVPVHFTAFHPAYRMAHLPPTPSSTLARACHIGQVNGLRFVYGGNVADREAQSTRCPACHALLVERVGFSAFTRGLAAGGRCAGCGAVVPGRYGA